MTEWKTFKEVANELKISKCLVKYHRKNLKNSQLVKSGGIYYVSEEGVREIHSRLRKRKYRHDFEASVLEQLSELKFQQESILEMLLRISNSQEI